MCAWRVEQIDAREGAMMRQFRTALTVAAVVAVAGSAWGQSGYEDTAVKRLLGSDYDGAKIVAAQGNRIVTVHLKTRKVKTLVSFDSKLGVGALARPTWSPDGSRVLYAVGGKAMVVAAGGGSPRPALGDLQGVRDPSWWVNPGTKDLYIIYAARAAAPPPAAPGTPVPAAGDIRAPGGRTGQPVRQRATMATFLHRLKDGQKTKLIDAACTGGISRNGTHVGHEGAPCAIVDVKTPKVYRLNRGRPASDVSMSPDDTYRAMLLPSSGTTISIRSKHDRETWRAVKPSGSTRWFGPRWSNHADFCTATAGVGETMPMVLVKISTRQSVVLRGLGGNWSRPHLWLPSAAGVSTAKGPIDHLVLTRLNHYKAKVAKAKDYSPIIAELKRNPDTEAAMIVKALEDYGKGLLSKARGAPDARTGQTIYRDASARFAGHDVGRQARQTLGSPAFRLELAAATKAARFEALRSRLHTPPGEKVRANFYDGAYMARNRATLVEMVKLLAQMKRMHGSTQAYRRAYYYAERLGLPASTSEPGNHRIGVIATVKAVSPVPDPQHVLPAKDALVYVRYRVAHVTSGRYANRELVAVHWAVRHGRAAAAAKFAVGQRHNLTLDLFDAHAELEKITASADANDPDLPPYWAISVQPLR